MRHRPKLFVVVTRISVGPTLSHPAAGDGVSLYNGRRTRCTMLPEVAAKYKMRSEGPPVTGVKESQPILHCDSQ